MKIVYQDYKLSSEREAVLIEQVHRLLDNLTPTVLGELPGTRAQSLRDRVGSSTFCCSVTLPLSFTSVTPI